MANVRCVLVVATLASLVPARAHAEEEAVLDKDAYGLFNPVPASGLRPLMPGETPITVDAGHVQVEVNLANATWAQDAMSTTSSLDLFSFAAKVGMTSSIEGQVMFAPWSQTTTRGMDGTALGAATGIGDATARLKINLRGNEGGTGIAVIPYLTLPTGADGLSDGALQPGLAIPVGFELPAGCAGQVAFDGRAAYDADLDAYAPELALTATLVRPIAGPVGGVLEWTTIGSGDGLDHLAHLQLTIGLGDNAELDTGIVFTPDDPTAMANVTSALTWRR